ncbi:MAG: hypothetical protein R2873_29115 [Caldilineaceae bacterium]
MPPKPPPVNRYELFLVRLWAEGEPACWRASARNVHTGEETHFATPERLFVHLLGQMDGRGKGNA